jgi:PKD repeat protein/endonuclease I
MFLSIRSLLGICSSLATATFLLAGSALAQAPPGYYSGADDTNGTTLRSTLHGVIDDHTRFPYTSGSTDTWNILEDAQEDPNNSSRIVDVYMNESYTKIGGGVGPYNREHTWPKSYGFPNDNADNYPYTDCHMLWLCDSGYNSARSNKPFRTCNAGCNEEPTLSTNGSGGGSGSYPGNSNWTSGSFTSGTWEVWMERRGDIARAMFYADLRYEGGTHGVTNSDEPDLILTDSEALISSGQTGSNESVAYMGLLNVLLQWHAQDPVSADELARNDVVFTYQGNRNPFVDHPEWVDCIYTGSCTPGGDNTAPAIPVGLNATPGSGQITLNWLDNSEGDLAGYRVYRSLDGFTFLEVSSGVIGASAFLDTGLSTGVTYFYRVTAEDTSGNESLQSSTASAAPTGGGGPPSGDPWINEIHYDNSGSDTGEFFEIAGEAGLNLSGWRVLGYNGNGGGTYNTINLRGVLPDQQASMGTMSFSMTGMQNGAPDGLALVDPSNNVVDFISYEGVVNATNGEASGMTSTDIGVSESNVTNTGDSLQRIGTGASRDDFFWQAPANDSPDQVNVGQTFTGGAPPTPPAAPTSLVAFDGDGFVSLDWDDNFEPDLEGYDVFRSTISSGPYSQLNGPRLLTSDYIDTSVVNGTTYFYVVTATDTASEESAPSNEDAATPVDVTAPAAPTALIAVAGNGMVSLDWADNSEPDLDGYDVLRATAMGGPYTQLNGAPVVLSAFIDGFATNGAIFYYVVRAIDLTGNVSGDSGEANAMPVAPTPPTAMFSATPTSGLAPHFTSFTDLSTNAPTVWSWTFGDGGVSSLPNPVHVYLIPGTYTVTLTVTNADGMDTDVQTDLITVSAIPVPAVPNFDGTPLSGTSPLFVQFTDLSTNTPTSWLWDFGDGQTSTDPNPSFTFEHVGTHPVSLTVMNADGGSTLMRTKFIRVQPTPSLVGPVFVSFEGATSVPGLGAVAPQDVVRYDAGTDVWTPWFDGSDVGITANINAVHIRLDGDILMSFDTGTIVPGLQDGPAGEAVDSADIVRFDPSSVGANTAGSFHFHFDGSDIGLVGVGGNIVGLAEPGGGDLALAVGASIGTQLGKMESIDIQRFTPIILGTRTHGSLSPLFDGSKVGADFDSFNGIALDGADLLFSVASSGLGLNDDDIARYVDSLVGGTVGAVLGELDFEALGVSSSAVIDAVSYVP